jgi:hypothetical protein
VAGIERITVSLVGDDEGPLTLFRVCHVSTSGAVLADSFRSNYERDRPPRGWEARNVLIQMGLSMFVREPQAEGTARRFPKIGDHVARVELHPGFGTAYAPTGPPGHMTIWGRPLELVAAVVDIAPIAF